MPGLSLTFTACDLDISVFGLVQFGVLHDVPGEI